MVLRQILKVVVLSAVLNIFSSPAMAADEAAIRGERNDLGVKVVQNRYFLKAHRPELGIFGGRFLNEAYTKTTVYGARINYFFTEWLGLEIQGSETDITDSDDMKALRKLTFRDLNDPDLFVYPKPQINRIHATQEANLVGVPFYGKLNFFDMLIVYTDLYLTLGATKVKTDQGELSGGSLGAGIRFFILKSASFQIDFRDRIYEEVRGGKNNTKNSLSVDFGLSYFFF